MTRPVPRWQWSLAAIPGGLRGMARDAGAAAPVVWVLPAAAPESVPRAPRGSGDEGDGDGRRVLRRPVLGGDRVRAPGREGGSRRARWGGEDEVSGGVIEACGRWQDRVYCRARYSTVDVPAQTVVR